jgi:tetratricopeptide (TPR) repeat protein
MVVTPLTSSKIPPGRIALWLLVFIVLVYSSSLDAAWHLDDYANILQDTSIHIEELNPASIADSLASPSPHGRGLISSRPLPRLSFALNWFWHQSDVAGYHWVNIGIHFVTAMLLYGTILSLFQASPPLQGYDAGNQQFIALLSTVLWAVNPVQTQAVTYIVQRMAVMAAMFSILALFAYVKGRIAQEPSKRWLWWASAILAFAAAMMCKENAVLVPLSVTLLEVVFFQDIARPEIRRRWLLIVGGVGGVLMLACVMFFLGGDLSNILGGYNARFFTPGERLLTQPRVLWFYLSLLIYPMPARLNIAHDLTISTSFLQPWTTLPAIIGLLALLILGLLLMRRQPLTSFAILFFFLNHAVESSILPLEMVYEHRNYLPSMFLFVPAAAGYKNLLDHFRKHRNRLYYLLVFMGIAVITAWGMSTYVRNMTWQTEETLWRDAMSKSPHARRPLHNLAWGHYEATGQLDIAYALYAQAATLRIHSRAGKALSINNMANIHYRKGNYTEAVALWREALEHSPDDSNYLYRAGVASFKLRDFDMAKQYADRLLKLGVKKGDALVLKGRVLLWQGRSREARACFHEVFKMHPSSYGVARNIGIALMAMQHYSQAEILFEYAHGIAPDDAGTLVWLARLNHFTGDDKAYHSWVKKLADTFTVAEIKTAMQSNSESALLEEPDRFAVDEIILQDLIAANI